MNLKRALLPALLVCGVLGAQQTAPQTPPAGAGDDQLLIRTQVKVVIAPTTVTDSDGQFVTDLRPDEFQLYDNDKLQDIQNEMGYQPLSLVVVIQANNDVEAILPKIKRIGPLLSQLVLGRDGEVAILSYDSRVVLRQDFTSDADAIQAGLDKIVNSYSHWAVQEDAVLEASHMLRRRPANRRKVILLIGETRGQGNTTPLRDVLLSVQFGNIDVYTININRLVASFTAKPTYPRPDPFPTASHPLPGGAIQTPDTVAQQMGTAGNAIDFVPVVTEIMKGIKSIFVDNPSEFLTKYTGGREYKFVNQRDLERAIADLGEELHNQYLLSYSPNNKDEGGLHNIRVVVKRTGLKVRSRPSYWMAAMPE